MLAQQATQDHDRYWQGRALFGLARAQLQLGQLAAFERTTARFRAVTDSLGIRNTDDEVTDARMRTS